MAYGEKGAMRCGVERQRFCSCARRLLPDVSQANKMGSLPTLSMSQTAVSVRWLDKDLREKRTVRKEIPAAESTVNEEERTMTKVTQASSC